MLIKFKVEAASWQFLELGKICSWKDGLFENISGGTPVKISNLQSRRKMSSIYIEGNIYITRGKRKTYKLRATSISIGSITQTPMKLNIKQSDDSPAAPANLVRKHRYLQIWLWLSWISKFEMLGIFYPYCVLVTCLSFELLVTMISMIPTHEGSIIREIR